jgi:large subunit ribosomal protein L31e
MAKKEKEPQVILEREYVIPLRKQWLKVPEYKRANKAIKAIREFLVRHMKVYDRNLDKVKIDKILNNEIRFRGMRKPPMKIKVKAKKYDDGIVRVELSEIPKIIQYKLERERKEAEKSQETKEKKKEEKKTAEKKEEKPQEAKDKEEKKEATVEAGLKDAKQQARDMKHLTGGKQKQPVIHRMALQK